MNVIDTIKDITKRISNDEKRKLSFIVFGYTDLMLSKDEWLVHLSEEKYLNLDNRDNFESLKKIHGRTDVLKCPTWNCVQQIVFNNEIQFTFVDFQKYEGSELLLDLNFEIPSNLFEQYDAVLDLGSSEHIFNYPQVLINCHLLAKRQGIIYYDVPLNWPNHGFYNLSPTIFYDFYTENKATTLECYGHYLQRGVSGISHAIIKDIPKWQRFNLTSISGKEIIISYMVQKDETVTAFVMPIQRKYRDSSHWQ